MLHCRRIARCGTRALLLLAAAVICVPGDAGAAALTPLTPSPEGAPWSDRYQSRQHRVREAETKARLHAKFAHGDPAKTPGMDLYDVHFYDLDIELNPTTRLVTGTVTVVAEVVGVALSAMELNLDSRLWSTAARSGGVALSSSQVANILTVTLDRTYLQGETINLEVDYSGNPSGDSFGWDIFGSSHLIWTLSEPYGAREWWPCKDVNTDKADSVALHVTVPEVLTVASNGLLEDVTVPAAGQKTFHWRERYPIATYLVSVTAHAYVELNDSYISAAGDTMPIVHYVVPSQVGNAISGYAAVPDMIATFAAAFGEYPFIDEKYGHAQFLWGGGMEHQTCTSIKYNNYGTYIVSHELGHQWFGDLITCADFHHIWLNEGFATWSEAYWREQSEGPEAYISEMLGTEYKGPGTIYVEDPTNFFAIFEYNLTYAKASWIPHMLRNVLGDEDFFAALLEFRQQYGFGSATTEDFQAVLEAVSGLDLEPFFQQWIYGEHHPVYDFSWNAVPIGAGHRVNVRVAQVQTNTGLFTMPLHVRVITWSGPVDFQVQNSQAEEWYTLDVDDGVVGVLLDPDNWVLCDVNPLGASAVGADVPDAPRLDGAAPNPFNPTTTLSFHLPRAMPARLTLHDVGGRLIAVLADGELAAGSHSRRWRGEDRQGRTVASGTYFARLQADGQSQVRALTLIR